MTQFIDRRLNGKNKSAVNRQRFIRRFKKQIKEAVEKSISKRSITNINKGEKITLPQKDILEPVFQHGTGGSKNFSLPGNKEFKQGDEITRPPGGTEKGEESNASNKGEGLDEFGFEISKEEFMDLFFENLELPNLIKTKLHHTTSYKLVRAGYTTKGVPANINILRSLQNAYGRRIAFSSSYKKKLESAERKLRCEKDKNDPDTEKVKNLCAEIKTLSRKIKKIPFIDEFDIRYNNKIKQQSFNTSAVMFCIMDVSGSMDEAKKDIAKRFFILLYLFLSKTYDKIELVFIRHHTTAKEVNEEEFFYSRETGGTVVSSAIELMKKIIQERFPTDDWNIYAAQASDGDNWNADSPLCEELLINEIMPYVQYYAYVEIIPRHHQSLWRAYSHVKKSYENFAMQNIHSANEIYPVFHELFKKKES